MQLTIAKRIAFLPNLAQINRVSTRLFSSSLKIFYERNGQRQRTPDNGWANRPNPLERRERSVNSYSETRMPQERREKAFLDRPGSRACFICGSTEHVKRSCPQAQKATCYNCGEEGHFARECTQEKQARSSAHITCFTCGEKGHASRECKKATCYNCGELGHMASACPNPKVQHESDVPSWRNQQVGVRQADGDT